ncbi:hypothetical protein ECD227_4109 (plasmid) [Escherichia fergusonii ECD227]|nr:hypothetical protein ECD227_4109 [Escherichia fergusonii ECD227]
MAASWYASHTKFLTPSEAAAQAPLWAQIGHRSGVHAWVFDIAGPRSGSVRSHFSPKPGTGPSAALRGRGRIGSDSGLAAGCVAGTSSRGRRRRARCGPVVRLLQRAVFLEVGEDGANGLGVFDAGDDPHRAAAVGTGGDVDGKDPLEPLRPAHRTALLLGAARLVVGACVNRHRIARRPPAAPRGRQLRTQVCIRGEYAVEAGEMRARWRDQCRQLGDEVHRIPFDMRGPISPRRLELIPHPTLR